LRSIPRRLALAGAILAGAVRGSFADDLSGYVELSGTRSSAEDEILGLPSFRTDTTSFQPRLNFLWSRRIFPNFQAQAGAYYERFDDTIDQFGFERDSERTRLRPFVRLTLRSPWTLGEIGWDRNEETSRTDDLATLRLTRDTFLATAGWYPVDLPSARLEFSHVVDRDGTREFEDKTEDALRLTSDYTPVESTRLYYRGALEQQEDRIEGSEFRTITHNGQVNFSNIYFDDRWEISGSWNATYRQTRIEASGTGEIVFPVLPVGAFYANDDTPDEGVLPAAPLLADGNTLVGTAVNLGLVPPAGDDRPRNFGVDLGIERDVNVLRVWVDQDLPFEIASTFSWEIWTSADARFWTRSAVVPIAPFGPFDQRFELRFGSVLARYVKVVVRPLAPTVPNATSYPTILVTELEPFSAQPANDFENTISDTRNLAQASSRFRILERPGLYYETTYSLVTSTRGTTSWTLSNGVSLRHQFNRVWGVSARAAREDGLEHDQDRLAYVYSAAVTANPFETLRHSLIVSGYTDDTGGLTTKNHGAVFNTTALVYDGVDLNFLLGTSYNEASDGSTNDATLIGAGATLIPHRTVTVTLRYDDRNATLSAESVPDQEDRIRSGEAGIAYNPVAAVYLYASRRKEERTTEVDRTIDTFASSWSPFPGGALQLSISYNETHFSDLNETNRSFVPFARWNINPRSYVEVAYQALTRESEVAHQTNDIVTATLRIGF
jgi:hypothetical protein